jgi:ApbE superfamily uncharacterized protein (UPF0280 family)
MNPFQYTNRSYRNHLFSTNLTSFEIKLRETDLHIRAERDLTDIARLSVLKIRNHIEEYARSNMKFLESFAPLPEDSLAPPIVREMLQASRSAGVGPMASVAGAIAQFVGTEISSLSSQVIVENGGDIYANTKDDLRVGIFAAESPLSNKLVLKLEAAMMPLGICTSSATVGHSVSLGKADAVCVISKSAALADAAASAIGNRIKKPADIKRAIMIGSRIEGVLGIVVIIGNEMGAYGHVRFD